MERTDKKGVCLPMKRPRDMSEKTVMWYLTNDTCYNDNDIKVPMKEFLKYMVEKTKGTDVHEKWAYILWRYEIKDLLPFKFR